MFSYYSQVTFVGEPQSKIIRFQSFKLHTQVNRHCHFCMQGHLKLRLQSLYLSYSRLLHHPMITLMF